MTLLSLLTLLALAGDRRRHAAFPAPARPTSGPCGRRSTSTSTPASKTFSGSAEIDLELKEPVPVLWLNAARLKVKEATLRDGKAGAPAASRPGGRRFRGLRRPTRPLAAGQAHLRVLRSRARCRAATTRASSPCRKAAPGTSSRSSRRSRRAAPSRASTSPASRSPGTSRCACRTALVALSNSPAGLDAQRGRARRRPLRADAAAAELPGRASRSGRSTSWTSGPRAASTSPTRLVVPQGRGGRTRRGRASRRRRSSRCSRTTSTAPTPTTSSTRSRSPAWASRWSTRAS